MQKNDWYKNKTVFKKRRQRLRWNPTKAEYVLWQELRRKTLGVKFRRQFEISPYFVDFYCHEMKLIIEVDGPIHDERKGYDERRTRFIEKKGYKVIRFKNNEVLFEREKVMAVIEKECLSAQRLDPSLTLPS
jgi:very-short-patch-repair endonuclease